MAAAEEPELTDVEEQFRQAVFIMRNGQKIEGKEEDSNDMKLKYYSLYKQAMNGDNTASQPWAVQVAAKAKWDAYENKKGETKESCMEEYVKLMSENDPEWKTRDGHEEVLAKMTADNWQTTLKA